MMEPLLPAPFTPQQQGAPRRRMDPAELNALRQEVYGGGSPAASQRQQGPTRDDDRIHRSESSPSWGSASHRRRDGDMRVGFAPLDAAASRRSQSVSGEGADSHVGFNNARSTRETPIESRLADLEETVEEHVAACRREFENIEATRQRQQRHENVDDIRDVLRRVTDEVASLRRDVRELAADNEQLRDEVRRLRSERASSAPSAQSAGSAELEALRIEVNRVRSAWESAYRDQSQEVRLLRDELADEVAHMKKDSRQVLRDVDAMRDEIDMLRKRLHSSGYQQLNQSAVEGRAETPTRPNISLTVQRHAPANGSSSRRSVSGEGNLRSLKATDASRSTSGGGYVSVDENEKEAHRSSGMKAEHALSRPPREETYQPSVFESSMRRETEGLVVRALQQKRPAAVVSSRSLSRSAEPDHDAPSRGPSVSGDDHQPHTSHPAPVARVSLR